MPNFVPEVMQMGIEIEASPYFKTFYVPFRFFKNVINGKVTSNNIDYIKNSLKFEAMGILIKDKSKSNRDGTNDEFDIDILSVKGMKVLPARTRQQMFATKDV